MRRRRTALPPRRCRTAAAAACLYARRCWPAVPLSLQADPAAVGAPLAPAAAPQAGQRRPLRRPLQPASATLQNADAASSQFLVSNCVRVWQHQLVDAGGQWRPLRRLLQLPGKEKGKQRCSSSTLGKRFTSWFVDQKQPGGRRRVQCTQLAVFCIRPQPHEQGVWPLTLQQHISGDPSQVCRKE